MDAVINIRCAAPAYIGIDNAALNRAMAMVTTVTAQPNATLVSTVTVTSILRNGTRGLIKTRTVPAITVTSFIDHTVTQEHEATITLPAQTSIRLSTADHTITVTPPALTELSIQNNPPGTTTLVVGSQVNFTNVVTYTLPPETVTTISYEPQGTTTALAQVVTYTTLAQSNFSVTSTKTITPSASTLTLTLPASTAFSSGPTGTETTVEVRTFTPEPTTIYTTLPAQTQTTYLQASTITTTQVDSTTLRRRLLRPLCVLRM